MINVRIPRKCVPPGQKLVESTLFPRHFNQKYLCDDVELTGKLIGFARRHQCKGISYFFTQLFKTIR
jgi:hypothetical protein